MLEGLERMPEYQFNKSANVSFQEERILTQRLNKYENEAIRKGELLQQAEISSETYEELLNIYEGHEEWVKQRLSLDIFSRMTSLFNIHFYSPEKWEEIRKENNKPVGWMGGHEFPGNTIRFVNSGKQAEMVSAFNHELTHSGSHKTVHAVRDTENPEQLPDMDKYPRYGFANTRNGAFSAFNEAVTEMINLEMLYDYKIKNPGKKYLNNIEPCYQTNIIVFDAILEEAAKKLKQDKKFILDKVYLSYYDGNIKRLDFLEKAFGEGTLKKIANLRDDLPRSEELEGLVTDLLSDGKDVIEKLSEFKKSGNSSLPDEAGSE